MSNSFFLPIPEFHQPPNFEKFESQYGKLIKAWKWYDIMGNWLFCTVRYEKDRKKTILPFSYTTENEWIAKQPFRDKRPIMDLHLLKNNENVLLVEGEKCYDIAKENLSDSFFCTTWSGGTGSIKKTNWEHLENKKVYYWYDNDDPGFKTIEFLKTQLDHLILVHPEKNKPEKWDIYNALYDDKWSAAECLLYILNFTTEEKKDEIIKSEKGYLDTIKYPFKILGFDETSIYFFPNETGQVYKVKKGQLSKNHLIEIAPLEFWETAYGEQTRRGIVVPWLFVQDQILRTAYSGNPFSPENIRGRGAWVDNGRIAIHTGKEIINNNNKYSLHDYDTKYIYERLPEKTVSINYEKKYDTSSLLYLMKKIKFENELMGLLFIGWCVLAPFCGTLKWRPHIWITGKAGTGKSTILDMILKKLVGNFCIYCTRDSTPAGIRQNIKRDAMSVVIDEMDFYNEREKNSSKLGEYLDIARQASSGDTKIYKGTQDQQGKIFNFTGMFCFSSVNYNIEREADYRRFTILRLEKNPYPWELLKKEIYETMTDDFCNYVRYNTLKKLPVIHKNIGDLSIAVGKKLNNQGMGDQIGALLAGAHSLLSDKLNVKKIVDNLNYNFKSDHIEDEKECLLKIFNSKIDYISNGMRIKTTLLNLLHDSVSGDYAEQESAKIELCKYGVKYDNEKKIIFIAANYEWIRNILQNTDWKHNYSTILRRLPGFEKELKTVRFNRLRCGAVCCKSKLIMDMSIL